MKIYIVGSLKVNSLSRKFFFLKNLDSLKTLGDTLAWEFNIVGKYSRACAREIKKIYSATNISNDDTSSYYEIIKNQIYFLPQDAILFFLLEDHWFVCPHKNLFFYLLEEFCNSKADVLRITHLTELWKRENAYDVAVKKHLYKEYITNSNVLKNLWQKHPGAYLISLPGIFKKGFVLELLEHNKTILQSKKPGGFELYGKKAEEFVAQRSFITMVPAFHVLREVFWVNQDERAMDARKAFKIIKLRDTPDPVIKSWRRIIRLIMAPRVLAGRIKRKIYPVK